MFVGVSVLAVGLMSAGCGSDREGEEREAAKSLANEYVDFSFDRPRHTRNLGGGVWLIGLSGVAYTNCVEVTEPLSEEPGLERVECPDEWKSVHQQDDVDAPPIEDYERALALQSEAATLGQDVLGIDNQVGVFGSEEAECATAEQMRPLVERIESIMVELESLGAADTAEFSGSRILSRARDSLTFAERAC